MTQYVLHMGDLAQSLCCCVAVNAFGFLKTFSGKGIRSVCVCVHVCVWRYMKIFEDDQLMAYKPREKALLSGKFIFLLSYLLKECVGAEDEGFGQFNFF